jgi:hypothetical protein
MARLSDAEIDAALARGAANQAAEPRARTVRFDTKSARLIIDLSNDCTFAVPTKLIEGLELAPPDQLSNVELLGAGYALHWPELDVDITVPGLLAGVFGTRAHMARLAGQTKSEAKSAAARVNGTKGGRPRKSAG